jgi:hypothetical protein
MHGMSSVVRLLGQPSKVHRQVGEVALRIDAVRSACASA